MSEKTLVDIIVSDLCYLTMPCQHDVILMYSDGSTEKGRLFSWQIAGELKMLGKQVSAHLAEGDNDLAKAKALYQKLNGSKN